MRWSSRCSSGIAPDEPYERVIEDGLAILRLALVHAGARELDYRDRSCDPFAVAQRISVAEAFSTHAGIDLMATVSGGPRRCRAAGRASAPRG